MNNIFKKRKPTKNLDSFISKERIKSERLSEQELSQILGGNVQHSEDNNFLFNEDINKISNDLTYNQH